MKQDAIMRLQSYTNVNYMITIVIYIDATFVAIENVENGFP